MKIIIHRGQKQIGGNIIEIASDKAKIILDAGMNLHPEGQRRIPDIEGLFYGAPKYDAILVSHYHADHVGLINKAIESIPKYMGKDSYKILKASNDYRKLETPQIHDFFGNEIPIMIKDIKVTPFLCDHSAYDSYMFLIENNGKSVLYTGDFRENGRLNYTEFLSNLPRVDVIVIEGTTLSREPNIENIYETQLEEIAVKALKKHKGPAFIIMSAMNIERSVTAFNAAVKTDRLFLEDIYTALVVNALKGDTPYPESHPMIRVFVSDNNPGRYQKLNIFMNSKISRKAISKQNYLMCIRPSMISYLKKLNEMQSFEDGILFYGMWKGYKENYDMKLLLTFMEQRGVKVHTLHTSGHADSAAIDMLIKRVDPKVIIPVHTENEKWFDKYKENIEIVYDRQSLDV